MHMTSENVQQIREKTSKPKLTGIFNLCIQYTLLLVHPHSVCVLCNIINFSTPDQSSQIFSLKRQKMYKLSVVVTADLSANFFSLRVWVKLKFAIRIIILCSLKYLKQGRGNPKSLPTFAMQNYF
jgi:hypothetical protein